MKIAQKRYYIVSIIYNALKKTQEQRENPQNFQSKIKWKRWTIRALLLISVISISIYCFYQFRPLVITYFSASRAPEKMTALMKLDGVYLSRAHKIAMINQQMYTLGSDINNLKIIEIDDNHILLQDAHRHITTLPLRS